MAGRNRQSSSGDRRPQLPKKGRGSARGHGKHHRTGKAGRGAPRPIASGRLRVDKGVRERDWIRLSDDDQEDVQRNQRLTTAKERLEPGDDDAPRSFGVELEGARAQAVVLEVRKGNCLLELITTPTLPEGSTRLPNELRAEFRGAVQHYDLGLSSLVAAGDEVEVVVPPVMGDETYVGMLASIRQRHSEFRRLHPSGRAIQTLAANVDQVLIVASAGEPSFRPGFVDRVLVCAAASELPAALALNKIDLGVDGETEELLDVYRELGVEVFRTCATSGEGVEEMMAALKGKRTVLCGHSGVGKSSLMRAWLPAEAEGIRVGEVSSYTNKGKHTTTHARLYRLPEAEVIDTPGVREFTPADTDKRNLWAWFPEIAPRNEHCRFADCTHTVEAGCAVREAVEAGAIHPRRYESYERIFKTLPDWQR